MPQSPRGTDAIRRTRSSRRRALGTMGSLVAVVVTLATFATTGGPATAAGGSAATPSRHSVAGPPAAHTVTLVTGDRVQVVTGPDGKQAVSLQPNPDGTTPRAIVNTIGGHLFVVPVSAFGLVSSHRLDRALFDVTGLIAQGYDDAQRATLPVIVDYGQGPVAAHEARTASPAAAQRTVTIDRLGMAAFAARKPEARAFWRSITVPGRSGIATGLSDGATHVYLDGKVHATLAQSVAQIHAPQAWAAGYDGTGATVAVLDTGYDPTHPDLTGQVVGSQNFTNEADVVDHNGHGTHVASTIAGTGAASVGVEKGVAPGAHLLIGKVLNNVGSGEDSMVLAGMQWAVAQGADVVSMSLAGDGTDGTDPLSQAVNQLSATSNTLFVIAAGNNGSDPGSVTTPGSADAALTVGAVDSGDVMAPFSGRGPRMTDGAVKPDVVAPGVDIVAARAAGTSLGTPVNQYYTALSGTSMATPHVAGLAAIIEDEHPSWDGEQIKSAIVGSTVVVPTPDGYPTVTAFDAGSGRVDALQAIHQDVTADPTLSLGFFKWPQATLPSTTTPLTYHNDDAAPVTLTLALQNEDGTAVNAPGVTLSASQVTVPAHGQVSVDVLLDPTVATPGSYSGIVQATPDDAGVPVRTTFGFTVESEHYDVTVHLTPRDDSVTASHMVILQGLTTDGQWPFETRAVDAAAGAQSVTFRVAPGTYAFTDDSIGTMAGGQSQQVESFSPVMEVSADTSTTLDGNQAQRIRFRTNRPVVNRGAVLNVTRAETATGMTSGVLTFGTYDRLYAQPVTPTAGETVTTVASWELAQPTAMLHPTTGRSVPLRGVPQTGEYVFDAPVPELTGQFRLVDAGSVTSPDPSDLAGALALVAGDCTDLNATADAFAAAGAAGVVVYPGPGQRCAGTVTGATTIPVYQASAERRGTLHATAGTTVEVSHRANPGYVYDLQQFWDDRVPGGVVLDGTSPDVATVVEHLHTPGPLAQGVNYYAGLIGWVPVWGMANAGLNEQLAAPATVRHYVSTGFNWQREVDATDASTGNPLGTMVAPPEMLASGTTTKDTWYGGPMSAWVSKDLESQTWQMVPNRHASPWSPTGQVLNLVMPVFSDSSGHEGWGLPYYGDFRGKLYMDGKLIVNETDQLHFAEAPVPKKEHAYRFVMTTHRTNPFWQRSTSVSTAWNFRSGTPTHDHVILPLLNVTYRMHLTPTNTAPASQPFRFSVLFGMPTGAPQSRMTHERVQISWDGGAVWAPAKVTRCWSNAPGNPADDLGGCTVQVRNRAHGSLSLRTTGVDAAGHRVRQTIVDAYAVR